MNVDMSFCVASSAVRVALPSRYNALISACYNHSDREYLFTKDLAFTQSLSVYMCLDDNHSGREYLFTKDHAFTLSLHVQIRGGNKQREKIMELRNRIC